jgi:outer membrane protein assembly factor BamE (lipoprotein component of BamABCDE complex)
MVSGAVVATAACSPVEKRNGYVPNEDQIAQIEPGKQSEADVLRLLGSPSSVATFDERRKVWYYIGSKTETLAFFAPEIVDQQVVSIEFDAGGRVKDVKHYSQEDGREIELVDRQTPTRGKELGLLEQLFGNLGRFSSDQKK